MIVSCKFNAVKSYIDGGMFWWLKNLPWLIFSRLPAALQNRLYWWAIDSGKYRLAWDLADHANYEVLDVDYMMYQAHRMGKRHGK